MAGTPRPASPGRAAPEAVESQARTILDVAFLRELLDAVNEAIVILNSHRQIVFCNRGFSDLLGAEEPSRLRGLRPGEALRCVHAADGHDGCGTSLFCETCGANEAILLSRDGAAAVRECRIRKERHGESLDFRVKASPLEIGGRKLTIVAFQDISHEKRRRALEQIFFHDVLNTATAVRLNAELLEGSGPEARADLQAAVVRGANRLVHEIRAQRTLASAESGELPLKIARLETRAVLEEMARAYESHELARGRRVLVDAGAESQVFYSDGAVLLRVLENLTRNALEAVPPGGAVTLGCRGRDGGVEFRVHNPGLVPPDVRLRIFQRSFSTKGPGRGLGTYSVKLLTEKFLKGKASFSTSEDEGTAFTVWCPRGAAVPGGPEPA